MYAFRVGPELGSPDVVYIQIGLWNTIPEFEKKRLAIKHYWLTCPCRSRLE